MTWLNIVRTSQNICAILSITLNILLTFFILKKSPKTVGSYKYLMIYISWFEIAYSILDVIVSPIIFSHGSIFLIFASAKNHFLSKFILSILNSVYCGFFGSSMGIFAIHFIYRYFVATRSSYLKTFKGLRIIFWMLIPMIYGSLWGVFVHILIGPNKKIDQEIEFPILKAFDWKIQDIVYVGPYLYQKNADGTYNNVDKNSVIAIIIMCSILISSFSAIIYFGSKCYFHISNFKGMKSPKYRLLQSQLFFALVTQTMIPLILMQIPCGVLFIFTFLDKNLGQLIGIAAITIALFPAIDPLPTMFIVKNYRLAITGFFKTTVIILVKQAAEISTVF
ncbi:unnamed protein product [Caenorhabditis angaria]|uniref:Serpentine receptor class r-10 n=1 Tax=Caenorhabditis angaria TaxID=860376 RepID=A0A9P1IR69_9PELO|nr:unnamed protein product [Caenorhabditis angaria]